MQAKLFRRPMMAAAVAIVTDIFLLTAAVVLNFIRGNFTAEYTYTVDATGAEYKVFEHHPLDLFGVAAAAALVIAAAMAAIILVNALSKTAESRKSTPRIVGSVILLVISAAVIMLSLVIVNGPQPQRVEYFYYTDETMLLTFAEEKYADDYGALKIYSIDRESDKAELLAATDISEFADSAERYSLSWVSDDILYITYVDGMTHRSLQLRIDQTQ